MLKNFILIKSLVAISTFMACITSIIALNSVISIISLIITFVLASSYLLLTGIEFIAISYIIIYVGAIAILFLFVILMINIEIANVSSNKNLLFNNLPLGISIFAVIAFMFFNLLPVFFKFLLPSIYNNFIIFNYSYDYGFYMLNMLTLNFAEVIYPNNQIESLAITLYTYHSILIVLLALILLLAMLASIELSIDKNKHK